MDLAPQEYVATLENACVGISFPLSEEVLKPGVNLGITKEDVEDIFGPSIKMWKLHQQIEAPIFPPSLISPRRPLINEILIPDRWL